MGLDMYLYSYSNPCEQGINQKNYELAVKASEAEKYLSKHPQEYGSVMIQVRVAYWRKANAIHKYFVKNFRDGVDDCREIHVGRDDLKELLDICHQVKEDHNKAEELLPTQSGFFFGSTEYDWWYYDNIEDTIKQLTAILEDGSDSWSFLYQASW